MSLRAFHLFFIAVSIVLAAFVAAWAAGEYRDGQGTAYVFAVVLSLAIGAGLAVYLAAFQRKTRSL